MSYKLMKLTINGSTWWWCWEWMLPVFWLSGPIRK